MAELPKNLRIGYQDVKLTAMDLHEDHGCYNSTKSTIDYHSDRSDRETVNTIIHEVLHAVCHTQGLRVITLKDSDKEEDIVNAIANGLTQVFLDNPTLLDWIYERLHNGKRKRG